MTQLRTPSAPLFTDPIHLAPTDPTVIEGPDGRWWMFYTQRRAGDQGPGVTWVHGTDIGVAISADGGLTWEYAGVVDGLDPHPGRNTLWAPEVIWAGGQFHMFVSYISGVPSRWHGFDRHILHHTSGDLVSWSYHGVVPLSSERVIDAAVYGRPEGGFRIWFKDEGNHSWTWEADSDDLFSWGPSRPAITGPGHEGPNVFELGGRYWLIVDEWRGLAVYGSKDLGSWQRQGLILDAPGTRTWDHTIGRHADVVVGRDGAGLEVGWIFYFTHRRDRDSEDSLGYADPEQATEDHRTDIQVAQLRVEGHVLSCDRDGPIDLDLRRGSRYANSPTASGCAPMMQ